FMAESLDGGKVGFRSNRQFDILNENMVFRFTQDHVSDPGKFQDELEARRASYGNGLILLNLTCHDEVIPWGDPQATASRYAMVSAMDGVPMIFYGQEQSISTFELGWQDDQGVWHGHNPYEGTNYVGFAKFEQNFGKWIPHFKTWNKMLVWTNPPYAAGTPNDSRAMAAFYGRVNLARQQSPALRSQHRWFLNTDKNGNYVDKIMFCGKWTDEGTSPNTQDSVIAAVLFLNDWDGGHEGFGANYDISAFADKMGILNREDRLYNIVNLASSDTNFVWNEPKTGQEIYTQGFYVGFDGSQYGEEAKPATNWTDGGKVVQYLKIFDVSGFVPDDGLAILDPEESPLEVAAGTASYAVVGTAGHDVSGSISWTNALTGGNGSFAKDDTWTQSIPLATGTNLITFTAATEATVTTTVAEDKASNSVYAGGGSYADLNGGTFDKAWSVSIPAPSGNQQNGGCWTDDNGFGLWVQSGNFTSSAVREFPRALKAGDTFSIDFRNGWVSDGGGVGIGLVAVANGTVEENAGFRMYFNGGKPDEPNYYKTSQGNTDNGDTAIPHTMNGIRIEVTMTSDTAFTANLSAKDGSGTARIADEFDKPCNGFRVWNYNNHEEGENDYKHNIYVDNPKVTATASGAGE
ncbi:MAG: hypothetical protein J6Y19_10910, partial [Kiritimatiellae bacterium]|nr:hypothetical protein [Kiritimatiellia bacterium]